MASNSIWYYYYHYYYYYYYYYHHHHHYQTEKLLLSETPAACQNIKSYRAVRKMINFLHWGITGFKFRPVCFQDVILKMEATAYSRTLPNLCQATKCRSTKEYFSHVSQLSSQIPLSCHIFTDLFLLRFKHLSFSQMEWPIALYLSPDIKIYSQQTGAQISKYISNKLDLRNQYIFPTNWSPEIKIYSQQIGPKKSKYTSKNWRPEIKMYSQQTGVHISKCIPNKYELRNQNIFPTDWCSGFRIYSKQI